MKNLYTKLTLILFMAVFISCKKDKPEPPAVKIDVFELQNGDNLRFGEDLRIDLAAVGNPFITNIRITVKSDVEESLMDVSYDVNTTHYADTIIFNAEDFISEGTQITVTAAVTGTSGNAIAQQIIPYIGDSLVLRGLYIATEEYIYDYSFANQLYAKIPIIDSAFVDYWEIPNLLIIADTNSVSAYSPKTKSIEWQTALTYDGDEKVSRLFVQGDDILVVSTKNRFSLLNEQGGITKTEIPKDVKQIEYMGFGDDYIFIQDTAETYFLQNTSLIKTISFGGIFYEDIHYVNNAKFIYSDTNRINLIESNTSFSEYLAFINEPIIDAQEMDEFSILYTTTKGYYRMLTTTGVINPIITGPTTHAFRDIRSNRVFGIAKNQWMIHSSSSPYSIQVFKNLSDIAGKPKKIFPKYQP